MWGILSLTCRPPYVATRDKMIVPCEWKPKMYVLLLTVQLLLAHHFDAVMKMKPQVNEWVVNWRALGKECVDSL